MPRDAGAAEEPPSSRHSRLEDAQGLFIGTSMTALGLTLLQHLGFVTGQMAGLALLISVWTGLDFGPVFFVLNLPFYWLAWTRMGPRFTAKSLLAVGMLSLMTMVAPRLLSFGYVEPLTGAILAGMAAGLGVLAVYRHRASLGGMGVLAIYLQERFGFRAGWTQMLFDGVLFLLAVFTLPSRAVAYSLIGAVTLNLVIAINHRRDRYIGM